MSASSVRHDREVDCFKIDPLNFPSLLAKLRNEAHPAKPRVRDLLVDPVDTCNAECIYCPNTRSKGRLDPDEFEEFLADGVSAIDYLQFGCGQEPTVHMRLAEFFERVARTRPPKFLRVITNGTLLHRHAVTTWVRCGLSSLQLSIDTADAEIHDVLRPGVDLPTVLRNVVAFHESYPSLELAFSIVVTRLNLDGLADLVRLGRGLGVTHFDIREVDDHWQGTPRNSSYTSAMETLTLGEGQFAASRAALIRDFPGAPFNFLPATTLRRNRPVLEPGAFATHRAPHYSDN
jgi:molybdenum cofactor biosynthesis enzyme MoaA